MGFYEDHLNAVRMRWKRKYELSRQTAEEFRKQATATLNKYGWRKDEIEKILKDIK